MVATVIDSLVVELGLDPKNFNQQQKEALANFKRMQDEAVKSAKGIEEGSRRIEQSIGGIRTQALEMFAAFAGGKGVIEFAAGLVTGNAQLGRLERNLGISGKEIAKWQGAATIFGGDAKSMASSFTTLSDAFAGWKIGIVSPLIADFRAISTAGGVIIDVNEGVEKSLLKLSQNLKNIHDSGPDGPARAGLLGRKIGLDPALYDLMVRGPDSLQKVLDYVNKIGVSTASDIDKFGELEKRFNSMGLKAESIGRQVLGGEHGGASVIMEIADFLNMTPGDAWKFLNNPNRKPFGQNEGLSGAGAGVGSKLFPEGGSPRVKPGSGYVDAKLGAVAAALQGKFPELGEVTAGNDDYHKGTGSAHERNEAFDINLRDGGANSAAVAQRVREELASIGLSAKVIDEYKNPSARSTGGHLHVQLLNAAAAKGAGGRTVQMEINGPITIYSGQDDGKKIAGDFRDELLKRQSETAQSIQGLE